MTAQAEKKKTIPSLEKTGQMKKHESWREKQKQKARELLLTVVRIQFEQLTRSTTVQSRRVQRGRAGLMRRADVELSYADRVSKAGTGAVERGKMDARAA